MYQLIKVRKGQGQERLAWVKCASLQEMEKAITGIISEMEGGKAVAYHHEYTASCPVFTVGGFKYSVRLLGSFDTAKRMLIQFYRQFDLRKMHLANSWDFVEVDKQGNTVKCENGIVYLKLKMESNYKIIGRLDAMGNYIKGEDGRMLNDKHYFRAAKGWGVNYHVVKKMPEGAEVTYITNRGTFRIPRSSVTSSAKLMLSKKGYEVQYVVPEVAWTKDGAQQAAG
jgi:hypothetical protein